MTSALAPARVRPPLEPGRLDRDGRRGALLDVAAAMVADGPVEEVTMEAVAQRASVSRALVYKHFANRHELLGELYEREVSLLHDQLADAVVSAQGLREMLDVLVRGVLAAQRERGAVLAALSSATGRALGSRRARRDRDLATVRYFARVAAREFDLDEPTALDAMAITLGALPSTLSQWRAKPSIPHADALAQTYVDLAMGGLATLAARTR
jgi:AcrR family transcriptional regulator